MIKTNELKFQIEQLTKQQDKVLHELEKMKQKIESIEEETDQMQVTLSESNSLQSKTPSQLQSNSLPQSEGTPKQFASKQDRISQVKELANELLTIRDLVGNLEQKTKQLVNDQSQLQYSEKDVVHLTMVLIQAMTEWASEYMSSALNKNNTL